jgi:hypothetical protein
MKSILKKSYAAVAAVALIVSGYFITGTLLIAGAQYNDVNAGNLEEAAGALASLTPPSVFTDGAEEAAWTSRFGRSEFGKSETASPYRVTLIRRNGQVVFDTGADSAAMENHLDRPEFQDAITGGTGTAVRNSATLGQEYIYAAVAIKDSQNETAGILRLSRPIPSFSSRL